MDQPRIFINAKKLFAGSCSVRGKTAYELAVENGYVGTEVQWLASLKGDKGDKGDTGATGATGAKGDKGDKGDAGPDRPVVQMAVCDVTDTLNDAQVIDLSDILPGGKGSTPSLVVGDYVLGKNGYIAVVVGGQGDDVAVAGTGFRLFKPALVTHATVTTDASTGTITAGSLDVTTPVIEDAYLKDELIYAVVNGWRVPLVYFESYLGIAVFFLRSSSSISGSIDDHIEIQLHVAYDGTISGYIKEV